MCDQPLGDGIHGINLPVYSLSRDATRQPGTGALELAGTTDFLSTRMEGKVCLALFSTADAAASYRDLRSRAAGYQVEQLDALDLFTILCRCGETCPWVAVDMCPANPSGRVFPLEATRQALRARLEASLPR